MSGNTEGEALRTSLSCDKPTPKRAVPVDATSKGAP